MTGTTNYQIPNPERQYPEKTESDVANIIAAHSEKVFLNGEIHYVITNMEGMRYRLLDYILKKDEPKGLTNI